MNIKTITSTDGVNEVDFGSNASRFYWFQNIGTTAVHVSGNADIVAGADGVAELAAGDSVCIETLGGKVYVLGAGKVQIHNTGDKFCPFKIAPAAGGGEAVDAYTKSESDAKYAQKTDIPTTLPANGGNADTLNGMDAETIRSMSKNVDSGTSASSPLADGTYCGVWSDAPSGLQDTQGILIVSNYNTNGAPSPWSHRTFYSPHYNIIWHGFTANYNWYGWKEISTTPIKKMTFPSVATNASGGGSLFSATFGTPITIACTSRADTQCTPFFADNQWLVLTKDAVTLDPIPAGSYSFDVWYI